MTMHVVAITSESEYAQIRRALPPEKRVFHAGTHAEAHHASVAGTAHCIVVTQAGFEFAGRNIIATLLRHDRPPLLVFLTANASSDWLVSIWPLGRQGALAVGGADDLQAAIVVDETTIAPGLSGVLQSLNVEDPVVWRAIEQLCTSASYPVSTASLAASLKISRSSLYGAFSRAGLPPVAEWMYLLRMMSAGQHMMQGVSADETAARVGLSDATTLRRCVSTRLGMSLREMRKGGSPQAILSQWLVKNELQVQGKPQATIRAGVHAHV